MFLVLIPRDTGEYLYLFFHADPKAHGCALPVQEGVELQGLDDSGEWPMEATNSEESQSFVLAQSRLAPQTFKVCRPEFGPPPDFDILPNSAEVWATWEAFRSHSAMESRNAKASFETRSMPFNSPELVKASQDGDLEKVRRLVESGADVNSVGDHGMGPLLTFTPAVVEYLLAMGADPNRQKNEGGHSVLLGVAYFNNLECVRLLLYAGADAEAVVPETGETALHNALIGLGRDVSAADRHAVAKLLVEHGADVNRRTIPGQPSLAFWRDVRTRGETPLHRAAAYAEEETVEFLLQSGADKAIRDANGDSPQSWASWHWRPKSLIDLLDQNER